MLTLTLAYIAVCLLAANFTAIYLQSTLFFGLISFLTNEEIGDFDDYSSWLLNNVSPFWADLLSCPFCLSHWVALFFGLGFGIVLWGIGPGLLFAVFCMFSAPVLIQRMIKE